MSIKLRKGADGVEKALVAQFNALLESNISTEVHLTKTSLPADQSTDPPTENPLVIDLADATDLPTVILLANQEKSYINSHFADTVAHDSAVSAAVATADASDQTTANALLNALKAAYNTHRSEANVHFNDDAGNAVTSADATDLATSLTLANEIKLDANAHMALAYAGATVIEQVGP